jgi:GH15 family glucan-1,4-alpha-glucosidase
MSVDNREGYSLIADYALIGDTRTAALIASNGSLDWCCFPRFDSPAVFCKLLDAEKGGSFRIGPVNDYTSSRAYIDATNVLTTTFCVNGGEFRLTDFMPIQGNPQLRGSTHTHNGRTILRRIEGLSGECEVEIYFFPTFDFGRMPTQIELLSEKVFAHCGPASLLLQSPAKLQADSSGGAYGRVRIKAGEQLDFYLHYTESDIKSNRMLEDFDSVLSGTLNYWREWASRCTYQGKYRALVERSVLVLKLLTYSPTGAIVAAPTTSLPGEIGGERNWDYRYTWIRDSSLILHALMVTGYHDESHEFFNWLESICIKCYDNLQIMYTIAGDKHLPEMILPHLEGYLGSCPVRIGNAAAVQTQLDIYGELIDAMYFCYKNMRSPRMEVFQVIRYLADQAAARWHEPDAGIWEVRGGPRHYLYSKLQCWVALDRAIKLAEEGEVAADLGCWLRTREDIRKAILTQGYDEQLGAFVQAFDVKALDASVLMIPLLGFLPATDDRMLSTVAKICEQLSHDGFVYRYLNEDALPGGEGTFFLCSLWLVDNLVLSGQIDEARELFEKIISYGNDVSLFAEEFDPKSGELLGNYPQGYTHMALIRTAVNLALADQAKNA